MIGRLQEWNHTIYLLYLIATSGKNKFPINHHLISVRNSYSQGHLYYSLCFINAENSTAMDLLTLKCIYVLYLLF